MFITNNVSRSQLSSLFASLGETQWTNAELAVEQIWFIAACRQIDRTRDTPIAFQRTLFLSRADQILALLGTDIQVQTAYIVTPRHVNGSPDWKMEPLTNVWNAVEPDRKHRFTHVFETRSGHLYSNSRIPIEKLSLENLYLTLDSGEVGTRTS